MRILTAIFLLSISLSIFSVPFKEKSYKVISKVEDRNSVELLVSNDSHYIACRHTKYSSSKVAEMRFRDYNSELNEGFRLISETHNRKVYNINNLFIVVELNGNSLLSVSTDKNEENPIYMETIKTFLNI